VGWSRLSRDSICSRVCWSEEGRRRRRRCVVVVSSFQFPSPFPSIDVYHHPPEFSFLFPYPTCLNPHPIPQPSPHLFPFPSLESPFVRSSASRLAIQYIIPHIPSSPLSSSKNSRTTGTLNYSIFQTIYFFSFSAFCNALIASTSAFFASCSGVIFLLALTTFTALTIGG
jgi:hypothetical protein